MVISIETELHHTERGFIKLEDTVAITPTGCEGFGDHGRGWNIAGRCRYMPDYAYSAHIGYLFTDQPMAERIASATRYGFAAIEHPAPYSVPATEMAGWLKSAGARYVQLGLYSGDASKGEKGLGIFPDRRDEFRESVAAGAGLCRGGRGIDGARDGRDPAACAARSASLGLLRGEPRLRRRRGTGRGASRSSSNR